MLIKNKGEKMETVSVIGNNDEACLTVYDGVEPTLEEAQKHVGGYVERLDLESHGCLLVDEEGKLKRKPVNVMATKLYNKLFDGFVVGNVIHILPDSRKEW
jgi:hypothetical protein